MHWYLANANLLLSDGSVATNSTPFVFAQRESVLLSFVALLDEGPVEEEIQAFIQENPMRRRRSRLGSYFLSRQY